MDEYGLVRLQGQREGYVVALDEYGTIIGANGPHVLGTQDWNEETLAGWHMDTDVEWLQAADDDGTLDHLPIPYIPGVSE